MRRMTIFRSELRLMMPAALLAALVPLSRGAAQMPHTVRPNRPEAAQAGQSAPSGQNPAGTSAVRPARAAEAQARAAGAAPAPAASQPAARSGPSVTFTSPTTGEPVGQQPAAAQPAQQPQQQQQPQASAPSTHTVVQGETLWALAQQFLGDPMLWPEIYRLNTNVVEDPHWIYPGEELRLTAPPEDSAATAAAAAPPPTAPSVTVTPQADTAALNPVTEGPVGSPAVGPTIFSLQQQPRSRAVEVALERLAARAYRAVRDGEYYSAGFLTENQPLPSGRVIGDVRTSARPGSRMAVALYQDILVSPPPGDTLQTGNLLLAFRRGDIVGDYGEMVRPTALLRVRTHEEADHYRATVVQMYGTVAEEQEVLNIQPFALNSNQHAVAVVDGAQGHVIRLRDPHELAQRQSVMFIDKGANDGLKPGDLIQIYRIRADEVHGGSIEQDLARGVVVSTRSQTSTVLIVELYSGEVGSTCLIRQIGRMPS